MSIYNPKKGSFNVALLFILVLSAVMAATSLQANEQAVTFTHDTNELEWGACPSFIPQGCEIAVLHGVFL